MTDTTQAAQDGGTEIADLEALLAAPDEVAEPEATNEHGVPLAETAKDSQGEDEPQDDELEEVELDGKKGKVSKSLKDGYLRQSDYTQKTQAVAAERTELEQGRKLLVEQAQTHRAMLADAAKVISISEALADFEKVTPEQWMAAHAQDPDATSQARMRMQLLREERDRAVAGLQTKERERLQTEQREAAKLMEQRDAVLARDVKGWTKDSLAKIANDPTTKEYGFTPEEITGATDPRLLKALNELVSFRARINQQKLASQQAAQQTRPAPSVGGTPAPARRDPSKMGFRDFEKWANKVRAEE